MICSTFQNELFKKQYKEIEFVEPGTNVDNLYSLYRLGMFYKTENDGTRHINIEHHSSDPKLEPLTKIASDILGLDYEEVRTKLPKLGKKKQKRVCIGIHSTAQSKYWNNPNGWQDVVDYLKENGYEVRLLSREEDGYMGNKNPKGITQQPIGSLETIMKTLQESELFIGISSGLSWLSWATETPTIIISGFTDVDLEPLDGVTRIINKNVCNSCWSKHEFNPGDWNWCPELKDTERQFECSKSITSEQVIDEIKKLI
jgi:autotransporter strand-loop-strand O-heptosyltransferase